MSETQTAAINLIVAIAANLNRDEQKKFVLEIFSKVLQTRPELSEDIKTDITINNVLNKEPVSHQVNITNTAVVRVPIDGHHKTIKKTIRDEVIKRNSSLSKESIDNKVNTLYDKYYNEKRRTGKLMTIDELFGTPVPAPAPVTVPIVVEPDDDTSSTSTTSSENNTLAIYIPKGQIVEQPKIAPVITKPKKNLSPAFKTASWNYWFEGLSEVKCPCCNKITIKRDESTNWHASHIISRANGGPDEVNNVIPTCSKCNLTMGRTNMDVYMKERLNRSLDVTIKHLRIK